MNKITRREFLEGTSATVLASTSAYSQEQPAGPHFVPDGSGYALRSGNVNIFHLDPARLVPGKIQVGATATKLLVIGLTEGDVRSVEFAIGLSGTQWKINAAWQFANLPKLTASVAAPSSPGNVTFRHKLDSRQLVALVKHLSGNQLVCARGATLQFDVGSQQTEIVADAGQEFSVFDKQFTGRRLLLAPLSRWGSVELINEKPSVLIDVAKDRHLQLQLRAATHATARFGHDRRLSLDGALELLVHSPRCETTRIPCQSASRALAAGDRNWSINPTDGIWRLNTPRVSFDARVAEDGSAQPCSRPIEISAHDGKLKHFCIHTLLVSTGLAVEHVDRTRFDLGDASLQLRHSPLPPPKPKAPLHPRPAPVFAYAAPDATLRIPLPDSAKLRLWRGLDLFCLSFQFHNIDLAIGKKVQLIPLRHEEIDPAGKPDEAVLLAEFPPQHIMERTFLRQDRPLPDAGKEVSPAQLRQLQRLEAGDFKPLPKCDFTRATEPNQDTDSQCLRLAIQNEKVAAEKRDILGDSPGAIPPDPDGLYFPFASFANVWDKGPEKYGDKFGLWIGPAGLFSVEARRTARRFAEDLRLKRLNFLIAKQDPLKFDNKDFDDAAEILARPDFPMSRAEASAWVKKDRKDQAGVPTRDHFKKLWEEGARLSEDFRAFQEFDPKRVKAEGHNWLLFPDWPFSEKELDSIYQKAGVAFPSPTVPEDQQRANMQAATIKRLKEFKEEQSDTGKAPEGFRRPVEAWISEPSRLAFVMKGIPMALTVAELTAWENFELRVVQRARRLFPGPCTKGDPFGETEETKPAVILKKQGIAVDQEKTGVERVREIVDTVKKPDHFDTALEIPTGLILSPAQDAIWITPKKLPPRLDGSPDGTVPTPVWQARLLERKKLPSLRAVWSENFELFARDTFLKESLSADDLARLERWEAPDRKRYRTAMSPQDRAELVALTSMYGLPVIASKDKEVSSQIEAPREGGKKYISDAGDDPKSPYAIYMPVPLRARRLALGATGAMLDLDTTFPLVTSARAKGKNDDGYFKSFSLQRWRSLISDGSDVITVVVRRGYLFPLGHKASLVKVTEPRLRPIDPARPSLGYSVEQATRIYIEVTRASHQYPAVAQSYEARDFQPRDITLLTLRTPDLVDPADDKPLSDPVKPEDTPEDLRKKIDEIIAQPAKAAPHGRIRGWVNRRDPQEIPNPGPLVGQMAGIVFWPRTEVGTRGTVRFRMRIDGQPTPVSMPLIFADHRAASDPATMEALSDYYLGDEAAEKKKQAAEKDKPKGQKATEPEKGNTRDADKPKEWNKVQHNGALRTYADEQRKGQCTYVTDWQLLEAAKGDSNFAFNSELVAAEQPPFYPRLAMAQVRPQQIQGLTGSAAPVLHVAYERNYVHNGFNPPESCGIADPDTFLRVTDDPLPKLDMGDHGDQGGTVARPAKIIYGLNRRFGIAGPPPPEFKDCSTLLDKKAGEPAAPGAPSPAPVPTGQTPPPPPAPAGQTPAPAGQAPAPQALAAPPATNQPAPQPISTQALPPAAAPVCSATDAPRKYDNKDLAIGHFGDDAKLFGLIKLRDFIAALTGELGAHIPQLEEITNFTGDQLAKVAKTLEGPIDSLTEQLKQNAGPLLFPDFTCALETLKNELKRLRNIDPNLDAASKTAQQIEAATAIWASGQRVVRELEAIARTPISQYAERLRYYLISSQGDIAKRFQEFAPWNEIQRQLAELVAKAAEKLPGALVTILDATATANDLEVLSAKLKAAVADPDVWRSQKPLDTIKSRVGPLPNGITDLRGGPLYELAASLTSLAQQKLGDAFDQARLAEALKWAVDAIEKAEGIQKQIDDLIGLANSTACTSGVESLRKLLNAFVDTSVPNAGVKINRLIGTIRDIKTRLTRNAGDFAPVVREMTDYLDAWITILEGRANALDSAIAKIKTLAARTTNSLPIVFVCARFDIKSIQNLAALNKERQELLQIWLDFAAFFPKDLSPPALPLGAAALQPLWREIQNQMIELLRSAMADSETAALRYATTAGATAWKNATDEIERLINALPLPEMKQIFSRALQVQRNAATALDNAQNDFDRQLAGIAATDVVAIQKLLKESIATAIRSAAEELVSKAEVDLLDKLARPAMANLLSNFKPDLDDAAKKVLEQIAKVYKVILDQRNEAYRNVQGRLGPEQDQSTGIFTLIKKLFGTPPSNTTDGCKESWTKFILLVPPAADGVCDENSDALSDEEKNIRENRRTAADLREVLKLWQDGKSAPQRILQHIEYFARVGVRSSITRVLDVESLRQQIADALAEALPTTRTLKSSLSLPLKETSVGIGTFRPIDNVRTLTLGGSATINLLNPTAPQTKVTGTVTPFELDILSIMTFTFTKGVTYSKEVGDGRGKIMAPLGADDIKFGDKLSFLADLAKSLSFGGDGDGNGPYTIVHISNPSIEAGYRIGIPVITLGATFTNINFAGAIVLPFTSGSARVRAALGSLDNPFMISVGIYGGSGFMALEASPQGIEAFEASFQFGGIASIGYGPLQGTAYVTTGAYIRKDQLGCTFAALFSAGFTAHIACFGISAAFTLRLFKRAGDSSVSGEAALTFTFSIGRFIKISYTIRVQRSMQAGFGGGGKEAAFLPGSGVQVAALGNFAPICFPNEQTASLTIHSFSPEDDWSEFQAQFDPKFVPEAIA